MGRKKEASTGEGRFRVGDRISVRVRVRFRVQVRSKILSSATLLDVGLGCTVFNYKEYFVVCSVYYSH